MAKIKITKEKDQNFFKKYYNEIAIVVFVFGLVSLFITLARNPVPTEEPEEGIKETFKHQAQDALVAASKGITKEQIELAKIAEETRQQRIMPRIFRYEGGDPFFYYRIKAQFDGYRLSNFFYEQETRADGRAEFEHSKQVYVEKLTINFTPKSDMYFGDYVLYDKDKSKEPYYRSLWNIDDQFFESIARVYLRKGNSKARKILPVSVRIRVNSDSGNMIGGAVRLGENEQLKTLGDKLFEISENGELSDAELIYLRKFVLQPQ